MKERIRPDTGARAFPRISPALATSRKPLDDAEEPTTGDQLSADRSMSRYEIVRSTYADRVQPISGALKVLAPAVLPRRDSPEVSRR